MEKERDKKNPMYGKKHSEQKKNKNSFCSRKCLGIWTMKNRKGEI